MHDMVLKLKVGNKKSIKMDAYSFTDSYKHSFFALHKQRKSNFLYCYKLPSTNHCEQCTVIKAMWQ